MSWLPSFLGVLTLPQSTVTELFVTESGKSDGRRVRIAEIAGRDGIRCLALGCRYERAACQGHDEHASKNLRNRHEIVSREDPIPTVMIRTTPTS